MSTLTNFRFQLISPLVIDSSALYQSWIRQFHSHDEMQKYGLFLCPITIHGQRSIITSATAPPAGLWDSFTCTPLSFWVSLSLPPSPRLSPGLSAERHSAMMGFSDGIKMSRPTAVTHANCIVYRVYRCETVSNLFCLTPFFVYGDVIIWGPAASLVNVSDMSSFNLPLLSFSFLAAGLPSLLHGLLQYLQYPHAVSVAVLLSCCFEARHLSSGTIIIKTVKYTGSKLVN